MVLIQYSIISINHNVLVVFMVYIKIVRSEGEMINKYIVSGVLIREDERYYSNGRKAHSFRCGMDSPI